VINEEDLLRRAIASIKTQEQLPTSNGKDSRNPMLNFVDDMQDTAQMS
jgi:hypothetical protein